ncbi:MAG TPA: riboflavin biosynthesis protein RibF [Bacteroidota bacterium]|nr:riboflavin biosynthesis protein RibF [Bacteroidota bacterium]
MEVVHQLDTIRYNKNSVITIGAFDGVHAAHQEILREAVERASVLGGRSVVVTFEPHPKEVVSGGTRRVPMLCTAAEKLKRLEGLGIDMAFVVPFTYEFSRKTPREFYLEYIINGVGVTEVIEGYNHHFGRDREAGMNEVVELGKQYNFSVSAVKMMQVDGESVSSSRIRNAIAAGEMRLANRMLGYRYEFSGTVVRGHGRGRALGYPTANIILDDARKAVPKIGVYAVQTIVGGRRFGGMMSVGVLPTFFETHERTIEVNIFDFDEDIYDETITVECIERTRNEMKFSSAAELVAEMGNDKLVIQNILQQNTIH